MCAGTVVLGIIVSVIPVFYSSGEQDPDEEEHVSTAGKLLWPLLTIFAHLCSALDFVLIEMIMSVEKVSVQYTVRRPNI